MALWGDRPARWLLVGGLALNALLFGANFAYNLRHDEEAFARAKRAIEQRLESVRSGETPLIRPAWTPALPAPDFVD